MCWKADSALLLFTRPGQINEVIVEPRTSQSNSFCWLFCSKHTNYWLSSKEEEVDLHLQLVVSKSHNIYRYLQGYKSEGLWEGMQLAQLPKVALWGSFISLHPCPHSYTEINLFSCSKQSWKSGTSWIPESCAATFTNIREKEEGTSTSEYVGAYYLPAANKTKLF